MNERTNINSGNSTTQPAVETRYGLMTSGVRRIAGLIVLLLPALLVSMDVSILFVAAPSIAQDLTPSAHEWLWMLDSYSFVVAALLVTMGSLADRIGRKRLLLIGATAFGLASVVLAMAPSPEMFILGRVLLGIGAATLAPSTLAIIRDIFEDTVARRQAVAAWTVAFTGGAVVGPVFGGMILSVFAWPAVFLINIPIMVLLLIAGPLLLPESKSTEHAHFDLPGAGLSLVAPFSLVFAVKRFVEFGNDVFAWTALIVGIVVMAGFIIRMRRTAHPLIDLRLFQRGDFTGAAIANLLAALFMTGLGALAFTYLQVVFDLSPLQAALYALPTFAGTILGAVIGTHLARILRPGIIVAAGFLIAAAGLVFIGMTAQANSPWWFIAGYVLLTLGTAGLVSAQANSLIISTAPSNRTGAAASISETGVQLGSALGIAVFGLLSTVFYRAEMTVLASEYPAAADSVAGAAALAEQLPTAAATTVLEQAAAAFASSMAGNALLIALLSFGAVILTGFLLRKVPIGGLEHTDHEDPRSIHETH